jgi:2-hydroxy-3-keto-5-methylthiopentenyl-1-phosphate phosphatase
MCVAKQADYVIAKSYLLDFCRSNKIECGTFKTFEDVVSLVNKKLDQLGNGKSA